MLTKLHAAFLFAAVSAHAQMTDMNPAGVFLMDLSSGTSMNPPGWQMPMMSHPLGSWNTMFMGQAFLVDTQQSGPRGGDKLYSTNWLMTSVEHRIGEKGAFQANLMLSLEPATITDRRYPLLFQTGETAFGKPIIDGQHPHNFIMGLGVQYAYSLSENTTLQIYAAPVGDPALGPTAYPHRASAMEIPQATLSHHLQDSTHIADDVVTAGIFWRKLKLEASGFHGAEPGENRWIIQSGAIDSYSARIWFFPTKYWSAQVSGGRIAKPEALEAGDQTRVTASLEYSKPMNGSSWSSSIIWGRTHNTATHLNLNSYLVESVLPVSERNFITGRIELADKDELFADQTAPFRIDAYTIGYTHDIGVFAGIETGIGANFETYSIPDAIKPFYGNHPLGGNVFLRLRLKGKS